MDKTENPFSPGAGTPPPELVGRSDILIEGEILQNRVKKRLSAQSILLHGLRGAGKTVLLTEMRKKAEESGCYTISIEIERQTPLAQAVAKPLRRLLLNFSAPSGKVKHALAILARFIGALKISAPGISLDITPARGFADSGDLSTDLPDLLIAVAEAVAERQSAIIIFIDEAQDLSSDELGAFIAAVHKIQQEQLPLLLIGAGLPTLPKLTGDAKSYAERLFNFPQIDHLTDDEARQALVKPAEAQGVAFEPEAVADIIRITRGYPYFLQLWGYEAWNRADDGIIKKSTVQEIESAVISKLDKNFFRVRFDRLTQSEKNFLRAMAELPDTDKRTSEVAEKLGLKISHIGPRRNNLIKKGMIYSPAHGNINFTVPLFGDFMKRQMPILNLSADG